jgi:hypothetical protein
MVLLNYNSIVLQKIYELIWRELDQRAFDLEIVAIITIK